MKLDIKKRTKEFWPELIYGEKEFFLPDYENLHYFKEKTLFLMFVTFFGVFKGIYDEMSRIKQLLKEKLNEKH